MTLKERLRARGAPKLKIRSGYFLEVGSSIFHRPVDIMKILAGLQQKMPKLPKVKNAHCNFGAPRALRRSLSVIHSGTDLACRPGLTV
jgi:hypothetical protein